MISFSLAHTFQQCYPATCKAMRLVLVIFRHLRFPEIFSQSFHRISFKLGIYVQFSMLMTHLDGGVDPGSSRGQIEVITQKNTCFVRFPEIFSQSFHRISFKLGIYVQCSMLMTHLDGGVDPGSSRGQIEVKTQNALGFQRSFPRIFIGFPSNLEYMFSLVC